MASGSPTITYGLRNASPTLTGALTAWNSAGAFAFSGEAIVAGVSFPDTLMTRPRGVSYAADGSVWGAPGGWVEFEHTGDAFEIYQKGLTGGFRLWVDGELSANAYPDNPTAESAGGLHYTLVEFGGSATRRIRLESLAGSLSFGGVYVKTGQSVAAPSYPLRLILVGDSFTEGTGAGNQASGFAPMLAHELGVADFRNSGSGGTGWEQNNPSLSRVNLDDRWTRDVVDPAPDMVVVAMGYNDLEDGNDVAIGAMAAAKLNELREAVPGCLVHVLGPWDSNAYASAAPDADAVSLTAALEEACEGIPGVWFHSMLGVAFEPVGGGDIHPALGGHTTIAHHGYDEIAAVHGLRPRS